MLFRIAIGALLLLLASTANAQVGLNVDVEAKVREYFADTPVMIEIARCESKFRQYADSGNPFYGGTGGAMVGVFQIYTDIHSAYALSTLNYDITTLDGNLGYAKYLYQTEGTKPWISSFPCWGAASSAESNSSTSVARSSTGVNLSLGMIHPEVLLLQKRLNALGYTVAAEGPGSPGQETEKFGALTRAAVKKFQCAAIKVCDGDEHSTGYGFVGARTRAALAGDTLIASVNIASQPASGSSASSFSSSAGYTEEEQNKIAALQAQIVALQAQLAALLAAR